MPRDEHEEQVQKIKDTKQAIRDVLDRSDEAEKLLNDLFIELGPYFNGKVSIELQVKLHRFWGFDDSE